MSQIRQVLSEEGKPMIVHESYIYIVERTITSKVIFRCTTRACKGTLIRLIFQLIEGQFFFH